jgi:HEAT repeat protein
MLIKKTILVLFLVLFFTKNVLPLALGPEQISLIGKTFINFYTEYFSEKELENITTSQAKVFLTHFLEQTQKVLNSKKVKDIDKVVLLYLIKDMFLCEFENKDISIFKGLLDKLDYKDRKHIHAMIVETLLKDWFTIEIKEKEGTKTLSICSTTLLNKKIYIEIFNKILKENIDVNEETLKNFIKKDSDRFYVALPLLIRRDFSILSFLDVYLAKKQLQTRALEGLKTVGYETQREKDILELMRKIIEVRINTNLKANEELLKRFDALLEKERTSLDHVLNVLILLPYFVLKGDETAITLITTKLKSTDVWIKYRAIRALRQISKVGDEATIKQAIIMLKDSEIAIKEQAIKILGEKTIVGNKKVINLLLQKLSGNEQTSTITSVMWALGEITEVGNEKVIFELIKLIAIGIDDDAPTATIRALTEGINATNKGNAIKLLIKIAKGNKKAIDVIIDMLSVCKIRIDNKEAMDKSNLFAIEEAAKFLLSIIAKENKEAISKITTLLDDPHLGIKENAIEVLGEITEHGDEQIIQLLLPFLHNRHLKIRNKTIETLGKITKKGDRRTIKSLLPFLHNFHLSTRNKTIEVLGEITEQGDKQIIHILSLLLYSSHSSIRNKTIEALGKITEQGNKKVIKILIRMLNSSNLSIKITAILALEKITDIGNEIVITKAIQMLNEDLDNTLYRALINLLKKIAKEDSRTINTLERMLSPSSMIETRLLVLEALGNMIKVKNQVLITEIIKILPKLSLVTQRLKVLIILEKIAKGDELIITSTIENLNSNINIWSSLRILEHVSKPGDIRVISAIKRKMIHSNEAFRKAAIKVLSKIVIDKEAFLYELLKLPEMVNKSFDFIEDFNLKSFENLYETDFALSSSLEAKLTEIETNPELSKYLDMEEISEFYCKIRA